jgi:hypothetical protein
VAFDEALMMIYYTSIKPKLVVDVSFDLFLAIMSAAK